MYQYMKTPNVYGVVCMCEYPFEARARAHRNISMIAKSLEINIHLSVCCAPIGKSDDECSR